MVAKQVYMNYIRENEKEKCVLFKNDTVYFLDTGQIEFKGVMIPTCEAVFRAEDRYKEQLSEEFIHLFNSIKENLWEQKIFTDMLELVVKAATVMSKFSVTPPAPINGMQTVTNESVVNLSRMAAKAYIQGEDYPGAVGYLKTIISILENVPQFERLILDYLRGVTEKYDMLLDSYLSTIDKTIDEKAPQIFQQANYFKAWQAAKNAVGVYEKLKAMGRRSPEVPKKKALWFNLIKQNSGKMEFVLHSGKK
jgi:hypothetical protein